MAVSRMARLAVDLLPFGAGVFPPGLSLVTLPSATAAARYRSTGGSVAGEARRNVERPQIVHWNRTVHGIASCHQRLGTWRDRSPAQRLHCIFASCVRSALSNPQSRRSARDGSNEPPSNGTWPRSRWCLGARSERFIHACAEHLSRSARRRALSEVAAFRVHFLLLICLLATSPGADTRPPCTPMPLTSATTCAT